MKLTGNIWYICMDVKDKTFFAVRKTQSLSQGFSLGHLGESRKGTLQINKRSLGNEVGENFNSYSWSDIYA